jgi:hypothetical protein
MPDVSEEKRPDLGFTANAISMSPNGSFQFWRIDKQGADLVHGFQRQVAGRLGAGDLVSRR